MFKKVLSVVAYVSMVYVNYLANALPINNRDTGAISDSYPNLFAPAGFTFAIWGVIYMLLGGFLIYQFTGAQKKHEKIIEKINPLFILSCIFNILWIFSWHYDFIGLSVIIMLGLFFTLMKIALLAQSEKFFISTPFSVYFGWISVALIANISIFLVSINWNRFGIAAYVWTVIILLIGATIGILRVLKDRDIAYGLVFVWAYWGILSKHLSETGFNGNYQSIITTLVICLVSFILVLGKAILKL